MKFYICFLMIYPLTGLNLNFLDCYLNVLLSESIILQMKLSISLLLACFSYFFLFKWIQPSDIILFVVTSIYGVFIKSIYDSLCLVKLFSFYPAFSSTINQKIFNENYVFYQLINRQIFKSKFLYVFFVKKYSVVAKNCSSLQSFDEKNVLIFVISLLIYEINNFFLSFL